MNHGVIEDFFYLQRRKTMKSTKQVAYKISEHNADLLTPIRIFKRLNGKRKFLLESSVQHEDKGKFSFIGADPYEEVIGSNHQTTVKQNDGTRKNYDISPLQYLKDTFKKVTIDLPLPFYGGAIGYVGYNATKQLSDLALQDDIDLPDIHFMIYKNIIVFNHATETIYLIALNVNDEPEHLLDARLDKLKEVFLEHPLANDCEVPSIQFQPEMTKENFIHKVKQAKKAIERGDVYQVVLSQRMKASFTGDPFAFYRQLRKSNASPYMFYIDFDDYLILGASPESLIQATGKDIVTNPIAGTKPRGNSKAEDRELMKELLADQKEIAEHDMLLELSKNDLKEICIPDSITVPVNKEIEKYEHVMHIVSEVHGTLKDTATSLDALIACLPAGTVSGEPKLRAMQLINELETMKRGVYGGSIGYINFNYDLNMALAIRFLTIKENKAYLQTGAGIVQDSNPEKEYEETYQKARSLMKISEGN